MIGLPRSLMDVPAELAGEPWNLVFQWTPPAWALALGFGAASLVAWISYLGLRGSRASRTLLMSVRLTSLLLVGFLLLGPAIEWPRERMERDVVHVLVDRSGSMGVRDERGASGEARSRDEVIRDLLAHPVWRNLADAHDLAWHAFSGRLSVLPSPASPPPAEGERTLLAGALDTLLSRTGNRPVAAVVVISDGRSQDSVDSSLLQRLRGLSAPVLAVALGDPAGRSDRRVVDVEHAQRAFPRDRVPVRATIEAPGTASIRVALRERASGAIIDERVVEPGASGRAEAILTGFQDRAGSAEWEIVILDGSTDADTTNDRRDVGISFVDRPLRVLFVDGWPRWEFRYLRNLLLRERGVESSVMLLSADRDFAQEGTAPISRLPATREEFSAFDVVVIGDVPGGFLDDGRQRIIADLVSSRGMGLLWIGGPRATPSTWRGTALENLLPLREAQELPRWDEPVSMRSTDAADRVGLLQLGDPGEPWPDELASGGAAWARLEWAQRIDHRALKPTAEAWATVSPSRGAPRGETLPIVVSMRYGAGSVAYVGTDETWRWRHGRGETLPERFWVQMIRHLARQGLREDSGRPGLEVDPLSAAVDQPVRITLDGVGDSRLDQVVVEAIRDGESAWTDVTLRPEGDGRFSTAWSAPREGTWTVRMPSGTSWNATPAQWSVRAERPEQAETRPDPQLLGQLAEATMGSLLRSGEIARIAELVPSRSTIVRQPIQRPLWDRWPFYALLALLLGAEWLGRRFLRLA